MGYIRMIQKPLVCRNAHCGASCDRMTVEQMRYLYKDITKCPFYERRDDFYEKESKSDWIPVSERLPKEFESVLVCYKSQGGTAQCVAERLVNMDGSNRWSAMYGQDPIAWMPLPEPYKESEEVNYGT